MHPRFLLAILGLSLLSVVPTHAGLDTSGGSTPVLPTVKVGVRKSSALESGTGVETLAAFTLTRTGDLSQTLLVNVKLTGTATNGVDYEILMPYQTIPAGQDRVTVVIKALADPDQESDETVILAIEPAVTYTVGSPATGTVKIIDVQGGSDPALMPAGA